MEKCSGKTKKGLRCKKNAKIMGRCRIHADHKNIDIPNIPNIPNIPTAKSLLKKIEDANVSKIVARLLVRDDLLKTEFFKTTGKRINCVKKSGGTRSHHYDFEIHIRGEGWKKVEHKGSDKIKDFGEKPWSSGVQFYNGTASKFSIGKKYARGFYDRYIGSNVVSKKYNIETPVPEYSIWETAACSQSKCTNIPFIDELRKKTVKARTPRTGLYEEKIEFTRIFNESLTAEDFESLKEEVNNTIGKTMLDKDYWLQIHGDLDGDFKVKWTKNDKINPITDIRIKKSIDCIYLLTIPDKPCLQATLRWGYNQGISNLRIDLK